MGAAAFLGGCSRVSLTTVVMIVEVTGDPTIIGPVGVATLVAVLVGNSFNDGLYHSLIYVASYPFLPDRWPKAIPKTLRVEHIIRSQETVACLNLLAQRPEVEHILNEFAYSGFPAVDQNRVVVGFTMREQVRKLLDEMGDTVDVGRVTDFHCTTIRASMPLEGAYNLFKRMEMSHMVVVDNNHRIVAMVTRASILPWVVEEKIAHRRGVRSYIQRPKSFRDAGILDTGTFVADSLDPDRTASPHDLSGLGSFRGHES